MKLELSIKLIVYTVLVSLIGWLLLSLYKPDFNLYLFLSVPVFLMLCQVIIISFIHKYMCEDATQSMRFLFITKALKIVASIAFVLCCYKITGLDTLFFVVFLVYYLLFIVFDSWLFMRCNKEYKKEVIE